MCKHERALWIGTADGIVCRGCGTLFPTLREAEAAIAPEEKPVEAEKKGRKKKNA